jgi:hypothetical protein
LTTMLSPSQRTVRVEMRRAASATPTTTHIHLYTSIHVQQKSNKLKKRARRK